MDKKHLSRRDVLVAATKTLAAGTAAAVIPGMLRAQSNDVVKIGLVFAKQGVWTEQGEQLASGVRIAMEQAGNALLGKRVEIVWFDEPSPQAAQQNIQKLIDEEKVVAVIGGSNSATSMAMASVARRAGVPYITPNAAAVAITGKECNPYTFRTLSTTLVASRALAPVMLNISKDWYFLSASYAYGQDVYDCMSQQLTAAGGKIVAYDKAPLGTPDFSSFILKIRAAKPGVVVAGLPGGDLSTFLKQWNEMGMKGKIPVCCPVIGDADLWSLNPDAATGYFGKPWHFNAPDLAPEDREFVRVYTEKFKKPPADKVWLSWYSTRVLISAINQNKSFKPNDIAKGLETVKINDAGAPGYYREWDHQMIRKFEIYKVKDKITDKWDWVDRVAVAPANPTDTKALETLFGTKQEIECKMEPRKS